jgi:hypothetical protein
MKKIIFITLVLSFIITNTVIAYNPYGISDGLYMKLQEEKSAIEYRISQLETSSYNSPGLSSMNIESRINDLERERDSKKNYATGTYAKYGATEMLQVALDKIDEEYDAKISALEDQKAYYDQQSSYEEEARENKAEAQRLKKKLLELESQLVDQRAEEAKKQIEALKNTPKVEINLINELTNNSQKSPPPAIDVFNKLDTMIDTVESARLYSLVKENDFNMYTQIQIIASAKYFNNKTTVLDLFNYLDSLSEKQAVFVNQKLGIFNPDLQIETNKLAWAKYPNGKEYKINTPVVDVTNVVKTPTPVKENPKPVVSRAILESISGVKTEVMNREQALTYYNKVKQLKSEGKTVEAQSVIDKMSETDYEVFESLVKELKTATSTDKVVEKVEVKPSFSQKFFGFFKKMAFWK